MIEKNQRGIFQQHLMILVYNGIGPGWQLIGTETEKKAMRAIRKGATVSEIRTEVQSREVTNNR